MRTASFASGPGPETCAPPDTRTDSCRWQEVALLLIGTTLVFAPGFTGEDVHIRGALVSRALAMLLIVGSLWTLSGTENFMAEALNASLGCAFLIAANCTHCVDAHRTVTIVAGIAIIVIACWAGLLEFRSLPLPKDEAQFRKYVAALGDDDGGIGALCADEWATDLASLLGRYRAGDITMRN
jgi:hypothetical protein